MQCGSGGSRANELPDNAEHLNTAVDSHHCGGNKKFSPIEF